MIKELIESYRAAKQRKQEENAIRWASENYREALQSSPKFHDHPFAAAESEAAAWLNVCNALGAPPIPRDPVACAVLSKAATATHRAGLCSILWDFSDGSKLTANEVGAWVR